MCYDDVHWPLPPAAGQVIGTTAWPPQACRAWAESRTLLPNQSLQSTKHIHSLVNLNNTLILTAHWTNMGFSDEVTDVWPSKCPCDSAAGWRSSGPDEGSSCHGDDGRLSTAGSSGFWPHLDRKHSDEPPHNVTTGSWVTPCGSGHTGQKGLFHGLHETLQIMLNIIHHNVDFIHITAHDDLLQDKHMWEIQLHAKHTQEPPLTLQFINIILPKLVRIFR